FQTQFETAYSDRGAHLIFVLRKQNVFRHQIVILIDRISRPLPDLQNSPVVLSRAKIANMYFRESQDEGAE
ncbi:MAG: hypothetical protein PVG01_00085, partial [Desulfobacterales bacterium]